MIAISSLVLLPLILVLSQLYRSHVFLYWNMNPYLSPELF